MAADDRDQADELAAAIDTRVLCEPGIQVEFRLASEQDVTELRAALLRAAAGWLEANRAYAAQTLTFIQSPAGDTLVLSALDIDALS